MKGRAGRRRGALALALTLVCGALAFGVAGPSNAENSDASNATARAYAGRVTAGYQHTCAIDDDGDVRCWGTAGLLGLGHNNAIGDDETVASAGVVNLGSGRTAAQLASGFLHTCALLDNGNVMCWGAGFNAQLGYGNTDSIGDNETPDTAGTVNLGVGRTATAITAGLNHTCALLDDGSVLCWGWNVSGQLGYGHTNNVGDDETPASAGPVDLGGGHTAVAISAGYLHTCAILDDGTVKCWGDAGAGRLGYGTAVFTNVGDDETPAAVGTVDLGVGRTAVAIAAGDQHTCAILDTGDLLCWGNGFSGQLGTGVPNMIGDDEVASAGGTAVLGSGRTAVAVSAGTSHTCAILDNGSVPCFGSGADGRLGYGDTNAVGDNETPEDAGPVDLGVGRSATAISASENHTCAALDNGTLRCWGNGANGRLGYNGTDSIGDDELPSAAGPVALGDTMLAVATASIADASITEGDSGSGNVAVTVTLTAAAPWPVTFSYSTSDDSATAGDDYTAATSTVTVPAGSTSANISVAILGDADDEPDEDLTVTISAPTPAFAITDASATVTITDDDPPPTTTTTATTTTTTVATTTTVSAPAAPADPGRGYWMLETDGTVYAFGEAEYYGDASASLAGTIAVDMDATPSGAGYWILDRNGVVRAYGDAQTYRATRELTGMVSGEHVVAILSTRDGHGYWIATNRGRVATYGNAVYAGDASELPLNGPVIDAARAEFGDGYYLAATDGGVFAFGSAQFRGSMGADQLAAHVTALAPDADGSGYWLAAADGGVFSFSAAFHGSMLDKPFNRYVSGMATAGDGYVLVGADGGVFSFGPARFRGGLGGNPPDTDIVTIVPVPTV